MSSIKIVYKMLLILLMLHVLAVHQLYAQDLHFSQYFNAPLLVNPANTGFNPESDYRLGINYRNQWANIGNPYKTMSMWGDAQLFNNRFENGWVGIGGVLLTDAAGDGSLTSTKGYASLAYHQVLGYDGLLSIGFGVGGVNKRVDASKLTFNDQWNGKFFDVVIPSNEPFYYTSVYYMDLNAGINYAYFATDNIYLNLGVSIQHFNRPKESFFAPSVSNNTVDPRYNFFMNGNIKIQNLWIFNPNMYFSKMGNVTETVIGMNANRNLSGDGNSQLILGMYYRLGDAAIPMIGYQVSNIKVTFNYDATTSSLSGYNGSQGAYEISLVKTGIYGGNDNTKKLKCPKAVRF
ncbi:PorP/SprF family type IX secretion system membrane protein [Hydrotalea flava]|uniref:PorP/SprF family type IX secretion system membrane protein n=1 Tax=Hydrotalea flava TaxID=714549 RepID=UPI000A4209D7|nr:PorP/SprF family type IX secretion system membrane protein [Hydrotalea flava]